ncbi:MAG: DNA polymerase III subunit delta' [Chloroflexi bacterium]|nr:DNA polymerase III subunit delta' [Chloroflexota bacterium]
MWQVIGQDKIIDSLKHSLSDGHLSHAHLFLGPKNVGKMTLAINLAQALNCESDSKPCGQCHICRRIASGNHPDIQFIQLAEADDTDKSSSRKTISVEQIRDMQYSINLKPYEGSHRVIIIDGADHMSDGAANSLLKTLEEPPSNTVFVLLAIDEALLLQTILSRCRKFDLLPMTVDIARQALIEQYGIQPERAELLARICHGRIGWAISAIEDESILEERSRNLSNLIDLASADTTDRFEFASELATQFGKSRLAVREDLILWVTWWRDIMLMKNGCADSIINIDHENVLREHAEQCSTSVIGETIKAIQETMQQLDQNANPRLALEVLMLNIPIIERERSHA